MGEIRRSEGLTARGQRCLREAGEGHPWRLLHQLCAGMPSHAHVAAAACPRESDAESVPSGRFTCRLRLGSAAISPPTEESTAGGR